MTDVKNEHTRLKKLLARATRPEEKARRKAHLDAFEETHGLNKKTKAKAEK